MIAEFNIEEALIHRQSAHWLISPKSVSVLYKEKVDNLIDFTAYIINYSNERCFDLKLDIDAQFGRKRIVIYLGNEYELNNGQYQFYFTHYYSLSEPEQFKSEVVRKEGHKEYNIILHAFFIKSYLTELSGMREFINNSKVRGRFSEFDKLIDNFIDSDSYQLNKERETQDQLQVSIKESKHKIVKKKRQFTYLMLDEHTGYYKIGKSNNPEFREKTLLSQRPTIKLIESCKRDIENLLHEKYCDKRVRGEWFALDGKDVEDIILLFK